MCSTRYSNDIVSSSRKPFKSKVNLKGISSILLLCQDSTEFSTKKVINIPENFDISDELLYLKDVNDKYKDNWSKWNMLFNSCNFQRMDVAYDNYTTNSIKHSERQKWKTVHRILFYNLQTTSIIPDQMDKFWACDKNKENLQ